MWAVTFQKSDSISPSTFCEKLFQRIAEFFAQ